jgi:S-DNA-T family DNA segregation ATPase FtsK/SpoIIIE
MWIRLGVGGPDLTPVGVDLFAGPQSVLISGPAGSGRSTAAAGMVQQLSALGVGCVVLCTPRSPLVNLLAGRSGVAVLVGPTLTDDVVRQAATALGTERVAVIADDCEQLTVVPSTANFDDVPTLLAEAATPDRLGRMAVVLCGNGMALLDGPRRSLTTVTRQVLDEGTRVLLVPSAPATAREHRIVLEVDQYVFGPPGRGYLARGREQHLVQLAGL